MKFTVQYILDTVNCRNASCATWFIQRYEPIREFISHFGFQLANRSNTETQEIPNDLQHVRQEPPRLCEYFFKKKGQKTESGIGSAITLNSARLCLLEEEAVTS